MVPYIEPQGLTLLVAQDIQETKAIASATKDGVRHIISQKRQDDVHT